jgi:hypothetical protein
VCALLLLLLLLQHPTLDDLYYNEVSKGLAEHRAGHGPNPVSGVSARKPEGLLLSTQAAPSFIQLLPSRLTASVSRAVRP